MTKDFSFGRLLLLIKKQWIENAKFYLYGTLALLGLLGIIFLFWLNMDGTRYDGEAFVVIFLVGFFLAGAIFASTGFNMLSSKAKGIYWLSFPASLLEKLICLIFYNLIVFTVVYCLCFFIIEQTTVSYIHHLVESNPEKYSFNGIDWNNADNLRSVLHYFFYAFFAVQSLYLLGSVYFRRYSFILTTIITAFVVFCFILFMQNLVTSFSSDFSIDMDKVLYARTYPYHSALEYKRYELNGTISNTLIFLVKFIWVPFFWLVTWFRLKEKEI